MLKIPRVEYEHILRHAAETYPDECCGVLLGTIDGDLRAVAATVRCKNTQAASDWFSIDPREIVRIQRQAAEAGQDIIGFYHSHPDDAAQWSASDLREAHWYGCSYVIVSVRQGDAREVNSFLLAGSSEENKQFQDEKVEITG